MQSFLVKAFARSARPAVLPAAFNFQARFIQLDPKLCFVQPAEVKDRMYELLNKFQVVDQEKLAALTPTAQFSELGLDRYVCFCFIYLVLRSLLFLTTLTTPTTPTIPRTFIYIS